MDIEEEGEEEDALGTEPVEGELVGGDEDDIALYKSSYRAALEATYCI